MTILTNAQMALGPLSGQGLEGQSEGCAGKRQAFGVRGLGYEFWLMHSLTSDLFPLL